MMGRHADHERRPAVVVLGRSRTYGRWREVDVDIDRETSRHGASTVVGSRVRFYRDMRMCSGVETRTSRSLKLAAMALSTIPGSAEVRIEKHIVTPSMTTGHTTFLHRVSLNARARIQKLDEVKVSIDWANERVKGATLSFTL
jgi:hypothetical protein